MVQYMNSFRLNDNQNLSSYLLSLHVTHTNLLWVSKPWVFTSQTIMFAWTHWLMACFILKSLLSQQDPWNTFALENYLQVSELFLVQSLSPYYPSNFPILKLITNDIPVFIVLKRLNHISVYILCTEYF